MQVHEFGIMKEAPVSGERFDEYEPEKYNCISVDDDDIVPVLEKLNDVQFYWHTTDRPGQGLAYCGITLIPPGSIDRMTEIIRDNVRLSGLLSLLSEAKKENRFVIHFGI